ncbi:unnamed protein product, partial [marine sediment metagenome]
GVTALITDLNSSVTNRLMWNRTGTYTFLANSGDSVGIGTDSPDEKLHVVAKDGTVPTITAGENVIIAQRNAVVGDHANIMILAGTAGQSRLLFSDSGDDLRGGLMYNHNGDDLNFRIAGANKFQMTDAGKFGVNKLNPTHFLDVVGVGNNIVSFNSSSNDNRVLFIGTQASTHSSVSDFRFQNQGDIIAIIQAMTGSATDKGKLLFKTAGASLLTAMVIDENQNVGIGTDAPAYKLEIANSAT